MPEERGKKKDLYGFAGTPIFEGVWLMCVECRGTWYTGERVGTKNFMLNFFCPALKYAFYLIKFNHALRAKLQFRVYTVRGESNLEQTPRMWDLL